MIEVSNCAPENKNFFSGNILNGMLTTDGGRKTETDRHVLEIKEERVALLKTGFSGKDIEELYLRLNGIVITDVNWQE